MDTYKEHIFNHMRELWTNWRSDLLRYNVTKKKITLAAAAKGKPPTGLDETDWKWLISEIYSQPDFKVNKLSYMIFFYQLFFICNANNFSNYRKKVQGILSIEATMLRS